MLSSILIFVAGIIVGAGLTFGVALWLGLERDNPDPDKPTRGLYDDE